MSSARHSQINSQKFNSQHSSRHTTPMKANSSAQRGLSVQTQPSTAAPSYSSSHSARDGSSIRGNSSYASRGNSHASGGSRGNSHASGGSRGNSHASGGSRGNSHASRGNSHAMSGRGNSHASRGNSHAMSRGNSYTPGSTGLSQGYSSAQRSAAAQSPAQATNSSGYALSSLAMSDRDRSADFGRAASTNSRTANRAASVDNNSRAVSHQGSQQTMSHQASHNQASHHTSNRVSRIPENVSCSDPDDSDYDYRSEMESSAFDFDDLNENYIAQNTHCKQNNSHGGANYKQNGGGRGGYCGQNTHGTGGGYGGHNRYLEECNLEETEALIFSNNYDPHTQAQVNSHLTNRHNPIVNKQIVNSPIVNKQMVNNPMINNPIVNRKYDDIEAGETEDPDTDEIYEGMKKKKKGSSCSCCCKIAVVILLLILLLAITTVMMSSFNVGPFAEGNHGIFGTVGWKIRGMLGKSDSTEAKKHTEISTKKPNPPLTGTETHREKAATGTNPNSETPASSVVASAASSPIALGAGCAVPPVAGQNPGQATAPTPEDPLEDLNKLFDCL